MEDLENGTAKEPETEEMTLASQLKQSRDKASLSIEQVAVSTKISISFIEAIEGNKNARLPDRVFCRGFLRTLAKLYDLDPDELLKKFEDEHNSAADQKRMKEDQRTSHGTTRKKPVFLSRPYRSTKRFFTLSLKPLPLFVLSFASLSLVVLIAYSLRGFLPYFSDEPKKAAVTKENTTDSLTMERRKAVNEALNQGLQVLEMEFEKSSKMSYRTDGKKLVRKVMNPGYYKFTFREKLTLTVDNPSVVVAVHNGRSLGKLGTTAKVKKMTFLAEDENMTISKKKE
ncbi:MAG: DUF4115 domain-containing protein [Pseudobacteriovorax sp.]|nr:DUF4115 domain-containing protein [Pseudobacteriovorax sp.]